MPKGRIRQTPTDAKIDSEQRILSSLSQSEKKTNQQLLKETRLSEPTLAKRLAVLEEEKKITVELSKEDRRVKYYSLTIDGWKNLEKETLKKRLDTTPLLMNQSSLLLKKEYPAWYLKIKGWDKPETQPKSLEYISRISPIFSLEQNNSTILCNFRNMIQHQFLTLMKKRYPDKKKKELTKGCHELTKRFFTVLEKSFDLKIFSSLSVEPPEVSKFDLSIKSQLLPFIFPQVKMDFPTKKYVEFFEMFLGYVYGLMKNNNYAVEDLFKKTQNSKIILVMEIDFSGLFRWLTPCEEMYFKPEEYDEKIKIELQRIGLIPLTKDSTKEDN